MTFDEFTGEVQHRLELPGTGESVRAIPATLYTLGQRIPAENVIDVVHKWIRSGSTRTTE